MSSADRSARTARWLLILAICAAFVGRAVVLLTSDLELPTTGDAQFYVEWAHAFAQGKAHDVGPFLREPVYAWFLGVVLAFGGTLDAALWLQTLLGTLSVWLTYRIGRHVLGSQALAASSAFLLAVATLAVRSDTEIGSAALSQVALLSAVNLTLGLRASPTRVRASLCGLAWGMAVLCEYRFLYLLVPTFVWIAVSNRTQCSRTCAAVLLGALLPLLPIAAMHRLVQGQYVLLTTEAGHDFWLGNHDASTGTDALWRESSWWDVHYEALAYAETTTGLPRSESAVSRFYGGEAFRWITERPGAAASGFFEKLRLLWCRNELSFAFLASAGIVGLVVGSTTSRLLLLLVCAWSILASSLTVRSADSLFLLPWLCVSTSAGGAWLLSHGRSTLAFVVGLLFVASGVLLRAETSSENVTRPPPQVEPEESRDASVDEVAIRRALLASPSSIDLRHRLGRALYRQGEFARARHEFDLVARANPRNREYARSLADCCRALGDLPAAAHAQARADR